MADFKTSYTKLLGFENVILTKTPGDTGGLSFSFLTKKNYPDSPVWGILEQHGTKVGEACPEAMPALMNECYKYFWQPIKGDLIDDQPIADELLSQCVLNGLVTGIKLLQWSLNVAQTGKMDEATLNTIAA